MKAELREARSREGTARPPMGRLHLVALALILFGALALRAHRVGEVPTGLFCDEAALGYNAFAIGSRGIDENGEFLPLYVWSFGGYKNPLYIYTAILPIKLLGLSELSLRMTSVFFGVMTVFGIYLLARELWGTMAGLIAAALLAVTPWHLHFSRIAFELVSFPCLFVFGTFFLARAIHRGGGNWIGAAACYGMTIYSYAVAAVFVPAFLGLAALLHPRELWRMRKWVLLAAITLALIWAPALHFRLTATRADSYFKRTSWIHSEQSLEAKARTFLENHQQFFTWRFLFEKGDPRIRHSVPGHGELHGSFAPMIAAGLVAFLIRPTRFHVLILWWIALSPVAASLMKEIPSATRAFIGSPLGPLIAAFGLVSVGQLVSRIPWIALRAPSLALLATAAIFFVGRDTRAYLETYFGPYAVRSAPGLSGFQFGYAKVVETMEARRDEYGQRMLTATSVNQPQIFVNFYTQLDPEIWSKQRKNGYTILRPQEYSRYDLDQPTLYSVRNQDLFYFLDYDVIEEVVAPGGEVEFYVIDARRRRQLLTEWAILGPFENDDDMDPPRVYPSPADSWDVPRSTVDGPGIWRPYHGRFVHLDLNWFHASPARRNPERLCSDAVTYVRADAEAMPATLEMIGSNKDTIGVWLNSGFLYGGPLDDTSVAKVQVELPGGWNEIVLRSCESIGHWYVAAWLGHGDGREIEELEQRRVPPADFRPEEPETVVWR